MEEREVITVGFGNYATLVAAQWANGTSLFDSYHPTLYRERRQDRVLGGSAGDSNARVRVPRLVLLDAPHASQLRDVAELLQARGRGEGGEPQARGDDDDDGDEDGNTDEAPSSLLFAKPAPAGGGSAAAAAAAPMTAEEREMEKLVRRTQKLLWNGHTINGGEEEEEEEEEADDYDYTEADQLRQQQQHDDDDDDDDTEATTAAANTNKKDKNKRKALMKKLFRQKDRTVPWWQYITTGVDVESITSLEPLQQTTPAGEVPAFHSFGHGLHSLGGSSGVRGVQEGLRRSLEDADRPQGAQVFVEGDSLFGGVAVHVLEELWEDAGGKLPVCIFNLQTPLPAALTDPQTDIAFAPQRVEESALNTLLGTSLLSAHPSAVYTPLEIRDWPRLLAARAGAGAGAPAWLEEDAATAQYAAAVVDTALYGLRDAGGAGSTGTRDGEGDGYAGPAYYMREWARAVRPAPSLRVASALGALPLPLRDRRGQPLELTRFLESNPLALCGHGSGGEAEGGVASCWAPLSHAFARSPLSEAGRVLGHAVALRGAGALPARAGTRLQEALLQYALPLRTSSYLGIAPRTQYPMSATFPLSLVLDADTAAAAAAALGGAGDVQQRLKETLGGAVDVGSHVCTTYAAAPMLSRIAADAKPIIRHVGKQAHYGPVYGLERDDWMERLEDVLQMADDYRHEDYYQGEGDDEDGDNNYDGDW